MRLYVLDIETTMDQKTIHCVAVRDISTGEVRPFISDTTFKYWLFFNTSRVIFIGHNIIDFDKRVLEDVCVGVLAGVFVGKGVLVGVFVAVGVFVGVLVGKGVLTGVFVAVGVEVGVDVAEIPVNIVYAANTLSLPAPKLLSAPVVPRSVAVVVSAASCCATVRLGKALNSNANAPETWGAAKEVPEFVV